MPLDPYRLDEGLHVAELAGLGVYARAVLAREVSDSDEVATLRLTASVDRAGAIAIDCEVLNGAGQNIGGFSL